MQLSKSEGTAPHIHYSSEVNVENYLRAIIKILRQWQQRVSGRKFSRNLEPADLPWDV